MAFIIKQNYNSTLFKVLFLLGSLYFTPFILAQKATRTDGELTLNKNATYDELHKKETATNDYINLYQKYISGARGTKCLMYPSCSNYGLIAFREKGFAEGFTLTAERLMRCGHESENYNKINIGDEFRLVDLPGGEKALSKFESEKMSGQLFAYNINSNPKDSLLGFIRWMINTEQYDIALLEIERLVYNKKYNSCIELYLNKLICLRNLNRNESALFAFENRFPDSVKTDPNILYQIALIHYKMQNFAQSLNFTNQIIADDSLLMDKKYRLAGIIEARKGNWENTRKNLIKAEEFRKNSDYDKTNISLIASGEKLRQKNAIVASALSIIPGGGYAYGGHYHTAITSFITNLALGYAVYTSVKTKNYGIAILTGSLNFGFYIGNIIGGNNSVKREYQRKRQKIINTLESINNINY